MGTRPTRGRCGDQTGRCGNTRRKEDTHLAKFERKWRTGRVAGFDVALEVDVKEFKHQIELLIGVHDVV